MNRPEDLDAQVREEMARSRRRAEVEFEGRWHEWREKMPRLKIPAGIDIAILPPFRGALVRFRAYRGEKWVSVFFDADNSLGYEDEPYWEIYPGASGAEERFGLGEEVQMMAAIEAALREDQ